MRKRTGECGYNGPCDYRQPKPHGVSASDSNELLCDENKTYKDGEPCSHTGCLHHVTHPCEGCGRIAGHKG